eukprot:181908-Pyramimonas_sp.AAC.1
MEGASDCTFGESSSWNPSACPPARWVPPHRARSSLFMRSRASLIAKVKHTLWRAKRIIGAGAASLGHFAR